jgi:hypothetical protein
MPDQPPPERLRAIADAHVPCAETAGAAGWRVEEVRVRLDGHEWQGPLNRASGTRTAAEL